MDDHQQGSDIYVRRERRHQDGDFDGLDPNSSALLHASLAVQACAVSAYGGRRYPFDQQHAQVRKLLAFADDFALHSLRHTFGTRLGETGADAFTIMNLMGRSSVTVSQKYVHPSSESMKLAVERMGMQRVPTNTPTPLKLVKTRKRASR